MTDLFGGAGFGGHERPHRGETDVWLTPPEMLAVLGPFDLDPCSPTIPPWMPVEWHEDADDGLAQPWDGFVWCNPPYGPQTGRWIRHLREHGNGLTLVFARTETDWFADAWLGDALLFLDRRITFHRPDGTRSEGNAGAPSVLIAYGPLAVERLRASGLSGALVTAVERVGPPSLI